MGRIRKFNAEELMGLKEEYVPIVDKIIYKGDLLLIKGRSKAGKSTLTQQLAFAISSGENFLRVFEVPVALSVCYISGEGFLGNWQERINNMSVMWKLNKNNFRFIKYTSAELHTKQEGRILLESLKEDNREYKLFVFDPLMYLCAGGNINNVEHMGQFFANVELIKREFDATAIVVHHDSEKIFTTKGGEKHKAASPDTSMGSSMIGGIITHSYTVERYQREKKFYQKVKAGNCRASWMIQELDLFMVTPEDDEDSRLGFTLDVNEASRNYSIILDYIHKHKLVSDHKLYEKDDINMPSATFYYNLEKLYESKLVRKVKKGKKGFYEWIGE